MDSADPAAAALPIEFQGPSLVPGDAALPSSKSWARWSSASAFTATAGAVAGGAATCGGGKDTATGATGLGVAASNATLAMDARSNVAVPPAVLKRTRRTGASMRRWSCVTRTSAPSPIFSEAILIASVGRLLVGDVERNRFDRAVDLPAVLETQHVSQRGLGPRQQNRPHASKASRQSRSVGGAVDLIPVMLR